MRSNEVIMHEALALCKEILIVACNQGVATDTLLDYNDRLVALKQDLEDQK